jgi:hypothetical protein
MIEREFVSAREQRKRVATKSGIHSVVPFTVTGMPQNEAYENRNLADQKTKAVAVRL